MGVLAESKPVVGMEETKDPARGCIAYLKEPVPAWRRQRIQPGVA
jgi:hypothetical protein